MQRSLLVRVPHLTNVGKKYCMVAKTCFKEAAFIHMIP